MGFLKGLGKRFIDWWTTGYPEDDEFDENLPKASPERKRLTERIKAWWQSGYNYLDEDFDNGHDSLEQESSGVEKDSEMLETLKRKSKTSEKTLEKEPQTLENTLEQPLLTSNKPSKEDRERLKEALKIEKGCLQYKANGDKVYLVLYDPASKKRAWSLLGTWSELKDRIPQEASS